MEKCFQQSQGNLEGKKLDFHYQIARFTVKPTVI